MIISGVTCRISGVADSQDDFIGKMQRVALLTERHLS